MSDGLPHRPRLDDAAMLRRHRVDGQDKWILHDARQAEALELTVDQVEQVLACDGTRDVGGILLAAARQGAYRRASEIGGLLAELMGRGLLADGTAPPHPALDDPELAPVEPADRPLEVLDFRLRCDGNGSCCTTYASIPFTQDECRRAEAAVPEVVEELGRHSRRFLPVHGAEPATLMAVTTQDGACVFLGDDGRCRVHARAGAAAKPRGCRSFPAQLVDDGEAVRVSVTVECPCVLSSLEPGDDDAGDSIVPEDATLAGLLPRGTRVVQLGESIAIAPGVRVSRGELRAFTQAALARLGDEADGVAVAWSLAEAVEKEGLTEDAVARGFEAAAPPTAEVLRPWLEALAGQLDDKCRSVQWRGARDRARRLADWLDQAARQLLEPDVVREDLEGPEGWAVHEAFILRASLWGYQLGLGSHDVVTGLRDRAVRSLLARRAGMVAVDAGEAAARYPITAVEAVMRGQGIDAYVARLTAASDSSLEGPALNTPPEAAGR